MSASLRRRARLRPVALAGALLLVAALSACAATVSGHGAGSGGSAGASTGASGAPATPRVTPIRFTDCRSLFNLSAIGLPAGRESHLSFMCGQLVVPADHRNESGPTVKLELVKVHDDANTSGRSLVVNPGGPGASGVELAVGLAGELADAVLSHYDIVGFDPRGVGLSTALSCVSDQQKDAINAADPNVLTAAGFAQAKSLAQSVASACSSKYGPTLSDFNTEQTAEDMDSIRAGLSQAKLDYLGFSYGTELGSVYAHLYPQNVGLTVLDGAVDPLTDYITSFADQLGGFEGAFDQFATDCLNRSECAPLQNPRQAVYALVKQADAHPIPTSVSDDTRRATGALVLTGVLSALYSKSEWPDLGKALLAAQRGDSKGILALADEYNERQTDGTYSNIFDANTAISCNDTKPGPTDDQIRSTAATWQQKYPMFGLWSASSLFTCQQWQPERTPVPPATAANTAQKVLVIGNIHDPATPYQGAKDLVKTMGNATLLTWNGEGHTSYLQGSTCIDNYVNAYLDNGTVPPVGAICQK